MKSKLDRAEEIQADKNYNYNGVKDLDKEPIRKASFFPR